MLAKLNWSETLALLEGELPLCCLTPLNACQRVYPILLHVFVYLTAELPLTVLYLSLPLRKLLQYLWLLCNCVCVWV